MKTNIERLMARVCEGTDAESELIRRFFIAYKNFLIQPASSLYREWIAAFLEEWREYRGHTDIEKIMLNDRALFENIKENGIRVPIEITQRTNKVDLSGCHRTIICHVLGYKDIPYVDGGIIPYQPINPLYSKTRERQTAYEKLHWAKQKEGKHGTTSLEYQKQYKATLEKLADFPTSGTMLDVGCGGQGGMSQIVEADQWYLADPLMVYFDTLFKRNPKHSYYEFGAEEIMMPDDSVDSVFCLNSLDHGTCRMKGLFEIYRVLKPGGYFGFWTQCRKESDLNEGHLQAFSAARLREELKLVGFLTRADKINAGNPDEYMGVFTK